jgi:hypothetical protein
MINFLVDLLVDFFLGSIADFFVGLYGWLRGRRRTSVEGGQEKRRRPGASQTPSEPTTPPG